jgi:hypothetical protein
VSLAETQRRLRELLAAPSGVVAALASPEERAACEALVRGARGVDGLARLEVYANAYFARIRDVVAECFPASAAKLGAALFNDLVTAYLLAHPPHHFSIRRVGDALPAFLASEAGGLPFRRRAPVIPDLALLECARLDAFDAADSPVVGREALAALAPERWGVLRLRFVPSLRLLRLAWPVEKLWAAHERGEPAPELAPLAHAACVWRRDERVLHRSLGALEGACLAAAGSGESFGALCERVSMAHGEDAAPAFAAGLLAGWLDAGMVAGVAPGAVAD